MLCPKIMDRVIVPLVSVGNIQFRLKRCNSKSVMNSKNNYFWISRLDYLFVLRPMLFFPGWSTLMAGYFIQSNTDWFPIFQFQINYLHLLPLLFGFALVMGSSFVLNQLKDIESDKKNKKLFIISNGILSSKTIWWEVVILTVISFFIAFRINFEVGILIVIFFILLI